MESTFKSHDMHDYFYFQAGNTFTSADTDEILKASDTALEAGHKCFLVDLSKVSTVDSGAIGLLARIHKHVSARNGRLSLVVVSPKILTLMDSCGLSRITGVFRSFNEADATLRADISSEDHGFYVMLGLPHEVSVSLVKPLRDAIDNGKRKGYTNIVFDFSKTRILTSVGIGVLMNLHKELVLKGGSVHLVGLSPEVQSLLQMSNVLTVLPSYASIEEVDDKLIGSSLD